MEFAYSSDSSMYKEESMLRYLEPVVAWETGSHCKFPMTSDSPPGGVGFPVLAKFVHNVHILLDAKSSSSVHLLIMIVSEIDYKAFLAFHKVLEGEVC